MTDFSFTYRIIKSRRKTLAIYIKNGLVEVRAPLGLDAKTIYHFLEKKSDWIHQKLAQQHIQTTQKVIIQHGAEIFYLGQLHQLVITQGPLRIERLAKKIELQCPDSSLATTHIEHWLQQQAMDFFQPRLAIWSEKMQCQNQISAIRLKKTKSQWGHCTQKGRLQFNWLLIMAPESVIDYVIVHELSHLQYMNHSALFWQRVAQFCPTFKIQQQWLKDYGQRLFFDSAN